MLVSLLSVVLNHTRLVIHLLLGGLGVDFTTSLDTLELVLPVQVV
jgi:hypothetical protein